MKFNIFFENGLPANKDILRSPEFKALWTEKEIVALFSHFKGECEIVHRKNTKKADTS